jgi:integrase
MRATTVFLARSKEAVETKNGSYRPFVPVEIKRAKPIAPGAGSYSYYARYSGKREDGSHGRIVKALGDNLEAAYVQFLNIDSAQKQIRAGHDAPAVIPSAVDKTSLSDAIQQYLEDCKSVGNAEDTIATKRRILESFETIAMKSGVISVAGLRDPKTGRKVLLDYLSWMKEKMPTVSIEGVGTRSENTRYKNMNKLGAFLKQQGIKAKKDYRAAPNDTGLLSHNEFPKYKNRKAVMYSEETITAWKAAATVDERDLIEFFLATGFRDGEVAHCEWSDINFQDKTINVHAKTKTSTRLWEWSPKDDESREEDIPLSDDFIQRMKDRRKRYAGQHCALIFPNAGCKPNDNLLRIARRAAKRAGITEYIGLHNIRKTFGSIIAEKYGAPYAMVVLGHSDLSTTQGYMAKNASTRQRMRNDLNS